MLRVKSAVLGSLLGLALLSGVSVAQAKEEGFELGARLGYGIPLGKGSDQEGAELNKIISGMIPLQLDLGYRISPNIMLGGYFQYAFGLKGDMLTDSCDAAEATGVDASCSTHDIRLGAQLHYHVSPAQKTDPWFGGGIGYEWLTYSAKFSAAGQSRTSSVTGGGFEFLNLQGGVDFKLSDNFALGPFLIFTLGQYGSFSTSCSGDCGGATTGDGDIENKAMHEWLILGIRGAFVL